MTPPPDPGKRHPKKTQKHTKKEAQEHPKKETFSLVFSSGKKKRAFLTSTLRTNPHVVRAKEPFFERVKNASETDPRHFLAHGQARERFPIYVRIHVTKRKHI